MRLPLEKQCLDSELNKQSQAKEDGDHAQGDKICPLSRKTVQ